MVLKQVSINKANYLKKVDLSLDVKISNFM